MSTTSTTNDKYKRHYKSYGEGSERQNRGATDQLKHRRGRSQENIRKGWFRKHFSKKRSSKKRLDKDEPMRVQSYYQSRDVPKRRSQERIHEDDPGKGWSQQRLNNEMSSFIAEFSYLTDEAGSKKYVNNHTAHFNSNRTHPHHVKSKGSNFEKNKTQGTHKHKVKSNRKAVEWLDHNKNLPKPKKKKRKHLAGSDMYSSDETSNSKRSRDRHNPIKYGRSKCSCDNCRRRLERSRSDQKSTKYKNSKCSCEICLRRSRSRGASKGPCIRTSRGSRHHKSKSRSPKRSVHKIRSERSVTPRKSRRSYSASFEDSKVHRRMVCCRDVDARRKSSPKQMPIKYQGRSRVCQDISPKRKSKENCIRYKGRSRCSLDIVQKPNKQNCIRYQRKSRSSVSETLEKEICIPFERQKNEKLPGHMGYKRVPAKIETKIPMRKSESIITLYPKNKVNRFKGEEERFLANPDFVCKCFECKRKYKALMKECLAARKTYRNDNAAKSNRKKISFVGLEDECVSECPGPRLQNKLYESDWTCEDESPCGHPCGNEFTQDLKHWFKNGTGFKSAFVKVNCTNHQIDSAIVQYFQNILRSRIHA